MSFNADMIYFSDFNYKTIRIHSDYKLNCKVLIQ